MIEVGADAPPRTGSNCPATGPPLSRHVFPRRRGARKPGPKGVPFQYGTGDPKTFGRLARWGHRLGLRGRRLRLSDASGAIGNAEDHFAPGSAHHIFRTPRSVHVKQRSTWAQVQRFVPNCTPRRLARADGQTPIGSATRLDAHASRRPPVPARRGRSQRRRRGLASSHTIPVPADGSGPTIGTTREG